MIRKHGLGHHLRVSCLWQFLQGPGEKEKEINDCKLIVQNIVFGAKTLLFSILYCTRHYHNVQQHEANGSQAQKWRAVYNGDGTFSLVPFSSGSVALGTTGTSGGSNVELVSRDAAARLTFQMATFLRPLVGPPADQFISPAKVFFLRHWLGNLERW